MQLSLNFDPPALSLRQAIDDFIRDYGTNWRKATADTHRSRLIIFAKWIEFTHNITALQSISTQYLSEYLNSIKDNSWYTRKASFVALELLFRWAVDTGAAEVDVFAVGFSKGLLKMPRKPRMVREVIAEDLLLKIISTIEAKNTPISLRDSAMFRLIAVTGIRGSEAVGINLADCDFSATTPFIRISGKGGDMRLVYPTPNTLKAITRWLEVRPQTNSNALFIEIIPPFLGLSRLSVLDRLKTWGGRAGVDLTLVSSRQLRKRYATQFAENGGSMAHLQKLLGHANLLTTEMYIADHLPKTAYHALHAAPEI